jgi:hypothetical protein
MIKFFRKIRQNLLVKDQSNKTSAYFKYAIGEIILVMVGILLALQVNNWNEKRVERNEIRAKLIHINEEIASTKRNIDRVLKTIDSVHIGDNQKSLAYLKSKNKDSIKKLEQTLGQFGSATSVVITIPSIDDFINSGHLSKISSTRLKSNMLTIVRLNQFSHTLDQYANTQLNTHMSPYFIKKLNLAQLTQNSDMVILNPIKDFSDFIGDRELENLLNLKIETDVGKVQFLTGLKSVLRGLEIAIQDELKK